MAGRNRIQPSSALKQAQQAAQRAQQRQEVMRLVSTLTAEQREQLSRLPTAAQVRSPMTEPCLMLISTLQATLGR